jgi:hypothetical protein
MNILRVGEEGRAVRDGRWVNRWWSPRAKLAGLIFASRIREEEDRVHHGVVECAGSAPSEGGAMHGRLGSGGRSIIPVGLHDPVVWQ